MSGGNIIAVKSRVFAVRTVRLRQCLGDRRDGTALAAQLLRSGTGIGKNVRESTRGQSKKDFIYKMNLALKECAETEFWLEILHDTGYLDDKQFASISGDCQELMARLVAIVKTARENSKRDGNT